MKTYKAFSPAKINLTLEIVKKLPDGFHALRSIMIKTQNLQDEIEIIFQPEKKGIVIMCDDKKIPTDERNICHKIATRFFAASSREVGLTIKIKKRIPTLAGLGGGSSNGAMTLIALNQYFGEPLSARQLISLAATIGKDIPVFLLQSQAILVGGVGEKLRPIAKFPRLHLILINPLGEIATGWAYGELDNHLWFMEDERRKNLSSKMLHQLAAGAGIGGLLYNDFSIVAEELFPVIRELKSCLLSLGAIDASITGKGPTVVGVMISKKKTLEIKNILSERYPEFWVEIA